MRGVLWRERRETTGVLPEGRGESCSRRRTGWRVVVVSMRWALQQEDSAAVADIG